MKIIEEQHHGESTLLWRLGNLLSIDDRLVFSLGLAWLFKENGKWNFIPRFTEDTSLFYNAVFFLRLTFTPFTLIMLFAAIYLANPHILLAQLFLGTFASFRWGSSSVSKSLLQTGFGFKLNGRYGALFRIQSDKTSAEGVTGPNYGQAQGFEYGTH